MMMVFGHLSVDTSDIKGDSKGLFHRGSCPVVKKHPEAPQKCMKQKQNCHSCNEEPKMF